MVAFLRSITVEGFRGIGPAATLTLRPTPGLTVVAGRNGSGKSTFAEGLDLAVTGKAYRDGKKTWLQDNWRNLHHPHPCRVEVELAAEGKGPTHVAVEWAAGAGANDGQAWVQTRSAKRQPGRESLQWEQALDLYPPLLSYEGIGEIFDAPSHLHDALESVLGLDQLTAATKRLSGCLQQLREPERRAKGLLEIAKSAVLGIDDERAQVASAALKKRPPDRERVRALFGSADEEGDAATGRLAALSKLRWPDPEDVGSVVGAFESAIALHRDITEQSSESADARDALLLEALHFHDIAGDGTCPVCGIGRLDQTWADRVKTEVSVRQDVRERAARAANDLATARQRFTEVLAIRFDLSDVDAPVASLERARAAVHAWVEAPSTDSDRTEHVRRTYPEVAVSLAAVVDECAFLLEQRRSQWSEIVAALQVWLQAADEVAAGVAMVSQVNQADQWLKTNLAELRNERLRPLADQARDIWARLRQESNVDLGVITLEGSATRRRVDLRARVDGADAGALGVMSQGELHALALALFIPRATSPDSPFEFLVLDDPIQAMDPSKVDGFLDVLGMIAKTRQVIVFTHDDRLPDALRRSDVVGEILQLTRDLESRVEIVECFDQADRYLEDAVAVAKDSYLAGDAKARVLPGLFRFAVEAACRDRFFTRELL